MHSGEEPAHHIKYYEQQYSGLLVLNETSLISVNTLIVALNRGLLYAYRDILNRDIMIFVFRVLAPTQKRLQSRELMHLQVQH